MRRLRAQVEMGSISPYESVKCRRYRVRFRGPEPANPFWEAEPEHQDYLERYPNGYTYHFPRADWVLPKRANASA